MIRPIAPFLLAAALAAATTPLPAQSGTATATITYAVSEINEIDLSGDPSPLVVTRAHAGTAPVDAVDQTTTWMVTTNQPSTKITGVLDSELPPGLTLRITLTPPDGGASDGSVPLSIAPQDLVTGFGSISSSKLGVTYTLSATTAAGVILPGTRIVTFTIAADT